MKLTQIKLLTLTLCFALASLVHGESIEQRDITIQHTVKAGESLHKITRQYLGTDILWQDNWQLNPEIDNPNNLKVGQILTIIKERIIPAEKAKVFNVVNRVEKKPSEGNWLSAQNGDELIQQEGVRTYAKSSALLEFNDESRLKVLEFSQIFLQTRSTGLTGTDSATIEVVKGDAELNWEPLKADGTEITIVTGGTISKPKADAGNKTELRTGITESGNSVISVYQGNSEVASAGAQVNVKQGMGLAVKPGEIPPEPKALLKAPQVDKNVQQQYAYANPWLNWFAVSGAVQYMVEICSDSACEQVLRQQKVKTNQWQINGFAQSGAYYFRVGAISEDELVGYRSKPQSIFFSSSQEDHEPPFVAIDLSGHRKYIEDGLTVGPSAKVTIHSVDALSGLQSVQYRWGNGQWQNYDNHILSVPVSDNQLTVLASDVLGQSIERSFQFNTQK